MAFASISGSASDQTFLEIPPSSASKLSQLDKELISWGIDHRETVACHEFEGLVALGVKIFEAIGQQDEEWRSLVFSRKVEHDPAVDQQIEAAYREWLVLANRVEKELASLEQHFGLVRHADEFRACRREAEGILTSDVSFFADGLTSLCDSAVDEHREGQTLEHR